MVVQVPQGKPAQPRRQKPGPLVVRNPERALELDGAARRFVDLRESEVQCVLLMNRWHKDPWLVSVRLPASSFMAGMCSAEAPVIVRYSDS